MIGQGVHVVKELHAEALAAAVGLEDHGLPVERLPRRLDDMVPADDGHRARHADPRGFEGRILPDLADLEVEGGEPVDDAPAVPFEPGQERGRVIGRETVAARVRGRADAAVEHALGRRTAEIDHAPLNRPLAPGQAAARKGVRKGIEPSRILVEHMDARHRPNPPSAPQRCRFI